MIVNHRQSVFIRYFWAVASGILLTLSFPTPGASWLAWVALVPLIVSLHALKAKQAFYVGIVAGSVHFLSLLYWIVPTISVYGGLPMVLALPVLGLLAFYLALYVGVFCAGVTLYKPSSPWMPLGISALWVGGEYLRASLFTGFPWGLLGYSLYKHPLLIQVVDLTGVYGLSFIIVMANACFAKALIVSRNGGSFRKSAVSIARSTAPFLLVLVLVLVYGRLRLDQVVSLMDRSDKTRVSVVQANISQELKWDKAFKESSVETYCKLSLETLENKPDLIVWPETALPFYYGLEPEPSSMVDSCIRQSKTPFIVGSPALREESQGYIYFNRAYMINRFSIVTGQYDKVHLVPFGEYVPFGRYLTFLGKITAQAGDFSSGESDAPLEYGNSSAGVLICFEVIFPTLARKMVNNGAKILVTITNDAWFGYTAAPVQHFSMALFRAVENRRAVARAANTGISGFIDPAGRIIAQTPLYKEAVLTEALPLLELSTLYTVAGDWFALICLIAMALVFMVKRGMREQS